jgi:hypothetical protein
VAAVGLLVLASHVCLAGAGGHPGAPAPHAGLGAEGGHEPEDHGSACKVLKLQIAGQVLGLEGPAAAAGLGILPPPESPAPRPARDQAPGPPRFLLNAVLLI